MAARLRRCVALGPAGVIYPGSPQDYRTGNNRVWLADSRTRWVRLWADWPSLMPNADELDVPRMATLDAQIVSARADGMRIILTPYRFPTWSNGTDAMTAEQLAATMPDRRASGQLDARAKSLVFRYPDDLSPTGAFGRFLALLIERYSPQSPEEVGGEQSVDVLELCNEPNLQWWPQQGPSITADPYGQGPIVVHDAIVRMFVTAKQIADDVGSDIVLAGPGSADVTTSHRLRTGYHSLAERILRNLTAADVVPGPRLAWTHHNYADVTYDQGPGSTAPDAATNPARQTNLAADMRSRLVGRWAGWPAGDAANPQLLLTEGGATLSNMRARYGLTEPADQRRKQAELIQRNWDRMVSDSGDGAGIAMTSQYLFYTATYFDSGLCDEYEAGGATRPSYDTWKGLASFD
jgi:hypothetical protein